MTALEDDLREEGPPEQEFQAGIAARLPRKRVAAGALIRDEQGAILLLQPTYKSTWVIPGGVVEENEDPLAACERELQEELGVARRPGGLLVVDWVPLHGVWGDSLNFIFDGGVITPAQAACFILQEDEIRSVRFVTLDEARQLVAPSMGRRLLAAMAALHDGIPSYRRYGRAVT